MGYLKEEKKKINLEKQQEKQNLEVQKLIATINAMTPEERQKLVKELSIELRLDSAKMKDLKKLKQELLSNDYGDKMSETLAGIYFLTHAMPTAFGAYFASKTLGTSVGYVVLDTLLGLVCGTLLAAFNGICYEKRPVSNCFNDLRTVITEKKIKKLSSEIERNTKLLDSIVSNKTPDEEMDLER